MKDITLIATHFYEFRWIETFVRQVKANTDLALIREILIIDQDRTETSRKRLEGLDAKIKVFQYPRSEPFFNALGHDHPAVLNQVLKEVHGEFFCIFDSDAHPFKPDWVLNCSRIMQDHDAVIAACHDNSAVSHPCFMMMRRKHVDIPLRFDDGILTEGIDTGRRIYAQLSRAGQKVFLVKPTVGFSGCWGSVYLDSIYHHGNGSFYGGGEGLKSQLTWPNRFFANMVFKGKPYCLSFVEMALYRIIYFITYGLKMRFKRILTRGVS